VEFFFKIGKLLAESKKCQWLYFEMKNVMNPFVENIARCWSFFCRDFKKRFSL